jgi:hypothetical protein
MVYTASFFCVKHCTEQENEVRLEPPLVLARVYVWQYLFVGPLQSYGFYAMQPPLL